MERSDRRAGVGADGTVQRTGYAGTGLQNGYESFAAAIRGGQEFRLVPDIYAKYLELSE